MYNVTKQSVAENTHFHGGNLRDQFMIVGKYLKFLLT